MTKRFLVSLTDENGLLLDSWEVKLSEDFTIDTDPNVIPIGGACELEDSITIEINKAKGEG